MVEGLRQNGVDKNTIAQLQIDPNQLETSQKERAILILAQTMTQRPKDSEPAVRAAISAGWSNDQVAEVIFLVSYFNMVTRVAKAFAYPPDNLHPFDPGGELPMLKCH